MALSITASTAAKAKGEDTSAEIARPLQDLKKCKYCNYEHWDEFDLRFHEEMHKEYCEEKRLKRKNLEIRNNDVHEKIQYNEENRLLQKKLCCKQSRNEEL